MEVDSEISNISLEEDPDGILSDGCKVIKKVVTGAKRKSKESSDEEDISPSIVKKSKEACGSSSLPLNTQLKATIDISTKSEISSSSRPYQQASLDTASANKDHETAKGRVIIIRPEGESQEISSFLGRTIHVNRLLEKSQFGSSGIENIKVNFKRKSLTLIMTTTTNIDTLCKIENLGEYKIKCFQPTSHTRIQGVIYQIGIETSIEELKECLSERENQKDIAVERIYKKRNGENIPTTAIKLSFHNTNSRPEHIYLGKQIFKVYPYVDRPIQCYNCQGFHHTASNCFSKAKCVVCAGNHSLKSCKNHGQVLCANCGAAHTASYAGCPMMKRATEVEHIKAKNNITQSEAIKVQQINNKTTEQQNSAVSQTRTNAWVKPLSHVVNHNAGLNSRQTRDIGCQTEQMIDTSSSHSSIKDQSFVLDKRFISMIIDLVDKLTTCKDSMERTGIINATTQQFYSKSYINNTSDTTITEKPMELNNKIKENPKINISAKPRCSNIAEEVPVTSKYKKQVKTKKDKTNG